MPSRRASPCLTLPLDERIRHHQLHGHSNSRLRRCDALRQRIEQRLEAVRDASRITLTELASTSALPDDEVSFPTRCYARVMTKSQLMLLAMALAAGGQLGCADDDLSVPGSPSASTRATSTWAVT